MRIYSWLMSRCLQTDQQPNPVQTMVRRTQLDNGRWRLLSGNQHTTVSTAEPKTRSAWWGPVRRNCIETRSPDYGDRYQRVGITPLIQYMAVLSSIGQQWTNLTAEAADTEMNPDRKDQRPYDLGQDESDIEAMSTHLFQALNLQPPVCRWN